MLCAHPKITVTCDIEAIDIVISNYFIILGNISLFGIWEWIETIFFLQSYRKYHCPTWRMYFTIYWKWPTNSFKLSSTWYRNIFYTIRKDDTPLDCDDFIWHMNFDGACATEGNGAIIVFYFLLPTWFFMYK